MERQLVDIDTKIEMQQELINSLTENFKLKFGITPYYFSGASSAMVIDKDGNMTSGFTETEKATMKISMYKRELDELEEEKKRLLNISKLQKYITKLGLTVEDLAIAYPEDLQVIEHEDDEDYED